MNRTSSLYPGVGLPHSVGFTICSRCGRITSVDGGSCTHCGAPLQASYAAKPPGSWGYRWDLKLGVSPEGSAVGLFSRDLLRHTVVLGILGSGKTTIVKRLVFEAVTRTGSGFLILDWEGEYVDLAENVGARILGAPWSLEPLRLNLFDPLNRDAGRAYAEWLASTLTWIMLDEGWEVSPHMETLLRRLVRRAVSEGAETGSLWNVAEDLALGPWKRATLSALEARLSRILEGPLSEAFTGPDTLGDPLSGRTVVDLSWISHTSRLDAKFLANIIVARAYYSALRRKAAKPFLVVIEEAEEVAPSRGMVGRRPSRLVLDMMHLRKRGVGLVLVSHSPSLIDQGILKLAGNTIAFRVADYDDARMLASRLNVSPELLQSLETGEAVVRPSGYPYAYLVKVEPPPVLDYIARELLESVRTHPHLTARERRSLLRVNGSKYGRAMATLKELGLVRVVKVHTGRGRPVELLEVPGMNPGAAHRFLEHKAIVAARMELGVEASKSSDADLSIEFCGLKIAVEVETGSNITTGKYLRLKEAYDWLIVLCSSTRCLRRASRALEEAGWRERAVAVLLHGLRRVLAQIASSECIVARQS